MFNEYDDDDFSDYKNKEESHMEKILDILEDVNMDYTESSRNKYDQVISLKNGVEIVFDEDGNLLKIQGNEK